MGEKPIRIQRKRSKGWRMPENTVYVGRGSKWGNWFRPVDEEGVNFYVEEVRTSKLHLVADDADVEQEVVRYFKEQQVGHLPSLVPLRGKNLACWCPLDKPCHADVLLELANAEVKP